MASTIAPLAQDASVAGPLAKFGIGQPVRRSEDLRFITGRGRYADDVEVTGLLHAAFLRSSQAHALLRSVDVSAARAAPGVVAVYTGADQAASGVPVIPAQAAIKQADGSPIALPPRPPLATDRVRFVGDCIAMVVAETARQAWDALELIAVEYAPLPAVADLATALAPGTAELWPEHAPGNLGFVWHAGDVAKAEEALKQSAHVVSTFLVNNRLVPNSMEPRGTLVTRDAASGRITFSGSIQNPFGFRTRLCETFGWPKDKLHCRAYDVGGGFGCKNQLQPEHVMTVFACEALKRPIKWINDRSGSFVSDAHARDLITHVALGLDASGRFTALKVDTLANLGAYLSTNGALIPTLPTAAVLGGAYTIPVIGMEVKAAFTNTVPVDAYRGAGRPEAIYLLERVIDIAAAQLGMPATRLRRRNLIKPSQLPYRTALGRDIDCGAFEVVLDRALDLADEKGFAKRAQAAKKQNKRRGFGVAYYLEATLGPPADAARIAFAPDGTATLSVGTQSNGQGHETTFVQIAAAQFGIAPDRVAFRQADTDITAEGGGHGGSRSLQLGGTAVLLAARKVIDKAKAIAAHLLETGEADLEFAAGRFTVAGTDRAVAFTDVVAAAFDPARRPQDMAEGLDEAARYEREGFNYPNGCHVCEVEIDLATCVPQVVRYTVVDDFGRIINPLIVRGQVLGGIAQGIGQALYEDTRYDADGQLLTASFMDYALPRAGDLAAITVDLFEDAPTATNPLGAKGCGEAGATGSPPAVVNAVCDALKEFGIRHLDMPLTRQSIFDALHGGAKGAAPAGVSVGSSPAEIAGFRWR
jgi:carbon-monoxide dehydrogenase large subunit